MKKLLLCITIILLCSCGKETKLEPTYTKTENTLIFAQKEFEYGDIIKVSDLIQNEDIVIKSDYLNTTTMGDTSMKIVYEKDNTTYQENINYTVKDTTPPIVYLSGSYSVTTEYKKDLAKAIACIDNYDKNPNCYIEGDYDVTKAGRYNLKYIAKDSNDNTTEIPFVLIVNKPSKTVYSNDVTKIEDVISKYKNDNTMIGIDVSKWQGDIDWKKVKEAGVEFVMIRIGTQKDFNTDEIILDPKYKQNIEGALENGIEVGLYFNSYATTEKEIIDQANFVIENVKNYNITFPIAYDWEHFGSITGRNMSLTDFRNLAYKFIELIENAGYKGLLYGSKNYLNIFWYPVKVDTWLAHYTYNLKASNYEHEYIMWQLCNNGKVNGINEAVDINIYYKSND